MKVEWYEEFISKDKYVELLKKYNLCTKKWTYGRTKPFFRELDYLIKKSLKDKDRDKE